MPMDPTKLRRMRRNLLAWHARHARDLPWRRSRDAYRVWISEIMLQQTTVAAVVPFFERFLDRFPNVASLAAADERDVLKIWEGLGYYSRARNLHRAARAIVEDWGGDFPSNLHALVSLPGIGRYTAGAIASFAFDLPAPIVEANTLRLYARLLGYRGDPRAAAGQKALWDFAERVLPPRSPGRFNEALMDLGATLCAPSNPACDACPLASCCAAFAAGLQAEIPMPAKRPDVTDVTHAAVAVERAGKWLVRQCRPGERWAGLWDFPRVELSAPLDVRRDAAPSELPAAIRREVESNVERLTGVGIRLGALFHRLRHSVTRYRIQLLCFRATVRPREAIPLPHDEGMLTWVDASEFGEMPLSKTGRTLADLLSAGCS